MSTSTNEGDASVIERAEVASDAGRAEAQPAIAAELLEVAERRLSTRRGRIGAWMNMFFADHGFFRYVYLNLHNMVRGEGLKGAKAYRAAQPAPAHFKRLQRLGVKTVVSLRGGRKFGSYPLEIEACARYGLAFEEITLRSRDAPTLETLEEAAALLQRVEYPALFHCKSGADRSGLMGALYMLLVEGASASDAKRALSARYGHLRQSPTGVLDAFIEAFEAAQNEARAAGGDLDFMTWARRDYDRAAVKAAFKPKSWARIVTDVFLRRE